jgi:hypothetical protein
MTRTRPPSGSGSTPRQWGVPGIAPCATLSDAHHQLEDRLRGQGVIEGGGAHFGAFASLGSLRNELGSDSVGAHSIVGLNFGNGR